MKNKSTWALFCLCSTSLILAGWWISNELIQNDHERQYLAHEALEQKKLGAALWRLESSFSLFIAEENARPHHEYDEQNFHFASKNPWVQAYFQTSLQGELEIIHGNLGQELKAAISNKANVKLNTSELDLGARGEASFENVAIQEQVQDLEEQVQMLQSSQPLKKTYPAPELEDTLARAKVAQKAYQKKKVQSFFGQWGSSLSRSGRSPSLAMKQKAENDDSLGNSIGEMPQKPAPSLAISSSPPQIASLTPSSSSPQRSSITANGDYNYTQRVGRRSRTAKNLQREKSEKTMTFSTMPSTRPSVIESVLEPIFIQSSLILWRKVQLNQMTIVQGFKVDLKKLSPWATEQLKDLYPKVNLDIRPLDEFSPQSLVTLPLKLWPPKPNFSPSGLDSNTKVAVYSLWTSLMFTLGIFYLLIRGMLKLSQKKGAFASAVTHELRTPLTTFQMYSEMLDEGMVKDPEKQKTYIKTLCRESKRLAHLVENVLSFSRLENKKVQGNFQTMDMAELMEQGLRRGREFVEQQGGQVHLNVSDSIKNAMNKGSGMMVHTDPSILEQILFNLCENACKYGRGPKGIILHIEASQNRKHIMLNIRDQGPGVPKHFRKKLFEPFCKSDREAADTASGVGLGLALCRQLAQQLGGQLKHLKSREGAHFLLSFSKH